MSQLAPAQANNLSHKEYLRGNAEYLAMQAQLSNQLQIKPIVSAYALFSTGFVSVETAIDFLFEREQDLVDGVEKYIHKFFG